MPTRARSAGRRYALGLLLAAYTCNFMAGRTLAVDIVPRVGGVSQSVSGRPTGPAA